MMLEKALTERELSLIAQGGKNMKNGFNNRNGKKVSAGYQNNKKTNSGNRNGACVSKPINVDAIYAKLKTALANRASLQAEYDREWEIIKRRRIDRTEELDRIDRAIGRQTHAVNQLLSELTQYRKTHRAMNLAYDYVSREINRIERIVAHWQNTIREVDAGRSSLISSRGVSHTNTTGLKNYVAKKRQQLAKLKGWKDHLSHYRVA